MKRPVSYLLGEVGIYLCRFGVTTNRVNISCSLKCPAIHIDRPTTTSAANFGIAAPGVQVHVGKPLPSADSDCPPNRQTEPFRLYSPDPSRPSLRQHRIKPSCSRCSSSPSPPRATARSASADPPVPLHPIHVRTLGIASMGSV